jgi:uncharacterized protein YkwD
MNARTPSLAAGILVAVAAVATSFLLPAVAVSADEPVAAETTVSAERSAAEFQGLINSLRSGLGLPALQVHSGLAASAQSWAQSMANSGALAHDPGLGSAVAGWSSIGENVGMGPSVSSIWAAFLASPQHYSNLTNPGYTHIGIGFVRGGQAMWTAHRFMTMGTATPPPPPPPPPTAPPVTAPPVTVPPAPVVTLPPAPVAPAPPVTAPVAPVTTPTPPAGSTDGGADGSGDGGEDASIAGDPSAEADRVAEVINALQALPV